MTAAAPPRALLLLLTVAAGVCVANLYYAQPLAEAMARALGAKVAEVGSALTATQLGYALGMVLLVPLGDGHERRFTIVATIACSVPALLAVAYAPSVPLLTVSSLAVGFTASVTQMLLPYAVDLVPTEQRGRVVGDVMSGLLAGILLSRTASGALAEALGWRAVFLLAAGVMALLGVSLRLLLPRREPPERLGYFAILRSLHATFRAEPELRRRCWVGGMGMGCFSIFWSMLSFHLATLGHGSATAGLFGVLGLVGVLVAPIAGRLATREHPSRLNLLALSVVVVSFAVLGAGASSLWALAVGVVLLDAGVQASHLTNQTVVFGLRPEARSRLNALYMVSYFAGGAAGTLAASAAYARAGWGAVCLTGAVFAAAAALPLLRDRAQT